MISYFREFKYSVVKVKQYRNTDHTLVNFFDRIQLKREFYNKQI